MNWITVSELCEQEGISHQCVYQKLKYARYGELKDHIKESYGEPMLLDEEAVEYLRPRKPAGNPKKEALTRMGKRLSAVEEAIAGMNTEMQDMKQHIDRLEKAIAMSVLSPRNSLSRPADDRQKKEA